METMLGKWLQETEEVEANVETMIEDDDSDLKDFGNDTSSIQNEYNPAEIETLNELIADEQHAMSAYFEAGKTTKNALLSRLYADIGKEEAFHSEQLLYAKSEITGEKYEPSDPEVKKEYEELLENGMDEETAMTTIADRHSLNVQSLIDDDNGVEEIEAIEADIDNLEEQFTQTFANCEFLLAICESTAYKNHYELRKAYDEFASSVIMEAMDNAASGHVSTISNNPLTILINGIRAIIKFVRDLIVKIKTFVKKRVIKSKACKDWIKKHGISSLFANGFSLYFYNDKTNNVEISDAFAYINLCRNLTLDVARVCGVRPPTIEKTVMIGTANNDLIKVVNKKGIPYSSLDDGVYKLNGVVFTKSKIIVNDNNQEMLSDMFFGFTVDQKIATEHDENEGGKKKVYEAKSVNIYNSMTYVLEMTNELMSATEKWMNDLQKIASNKNSIYYTDPNKFKNCLNVMKQVLKGYSKLVKCLTHDISACMKLDTNLMRAISDVDEQQSEVVNNATNGKNVKSINPPDEAMRVVGNDKKGKPIKSYRTNPEPIH